MQHSPFSIADPTPLSPAEVAQYVGGRLERDAAFKVDFVSSLSLATTNQAAWFSALPDLSGRVPSAEAFVALAQTQAGLLLLNELQNPDEPTPADVEELAALPSAPAVVRCANPGLAAALLSQRFAGVTPFRESGVHPSAVIHETATLGEGVCVGPSCIVHAGVHLEDGVVLSERVSIGEGSHLGVGCYLYPGVAIYQGVSMGDACIIHANTVIGADGFGYVWSGQAHEKVPQTGGVQMGSHIEIGALTSIDRGTYEPTVIGDGCIIDNQVQIGHNCKLGRFVVCCGQVALAGSTDVGDGAILAGRAGSGGHVRIGAGAKMAGAAVAFSDIPDGAVVSGHPAIDANLDRRARAILRKMARKRGKE